MIKDTLCGALAAALALFCAWVLLELAAPAPEWGTVRVVEVTP